MTMLIITLVVLAITAATLMWRELVWQRRLRAGRQWMRESGSGCATRLCSYLFDNTPLPSAECAHNYEALLTLLHSICSLTSGYDPRRVARLAHHLGLDTYITRRVRRCARHTRAVYALMAMQSGIDIDAGVSGGCDLASQMLFAHSTLRISDTSVAVRHLAGHTLSAVALAVGVEMRSRRFGTSDYQCALHSADPASVRVGLAAVRRFRCEEAATDIRRLVDTCDDELVEESLYALSALQLAVSRRSVAGAVARLGYTHRKRFYRHLVAEGYSSATLRVLCSVEPSAALRDYAISLGESHLRRLGQPLTYAAL